ncbi:unnamed protein product [Vitrella brassicaformis CCMP3155]|uniref:Ras-related protein Rab-18 n=1 Tax=Vitrella brassicaformis (strain CCMP3155) TaxID=1169540 RepID=A0A0G4ESD2_VITBC|nr:unnamed protein product [Vitrella brassicaformis CCMP3155]|mmetsp:Transcript_18121/g.43641  ORF Transcript_18121/g.43641 Transcript_18121/m.43641 type:complete len:211 (+) Transcript_18121:94-726(+)|eukprot:CEM00827.1 unnamed protein product [Vitrella brassicaformis CCMP3155]
MSSAAAGSAPASQYDHLFKLLLIGDSGVGKSSILLRFTDDEFNERQLSTIGVDFKVKYMSLNNKRLKLAIWDTAGQERFRTLTSSYYRGAQGIILVYDCSLRSTFDNLKSWLEEVRKYSTNQDAVKMLVANKIDKASAHGVSRAEGEEFAMSHSMLFIETSAKTRKGIHQAFEEVVLKVLDTPSLLANTQPIGARLDSAEGASKPSSSCC